MSTAARVSGRLMRTRTVVVLQSLKILLVLAGCVAGLSAFAAEGGAVSENASNPLSKGMNTDIRAQDFDLRGGADRTEYSVDGAFMASDKLKIKYEANYWDTDTSGRSEQDWESFHLKGIYYPKEGKWGNTPYRVATGLEWIKSSDNAELGIGGDSDLISPFFGVALKAGDNLTLIPLLQHYVEYNGDEVNLTAARLIGLWSLSDGYWSKLDAKLPYDWDGETAPATVEVQLGRMFSPGFGLYVEGLVGVGDDRPYNWGMGLGLRFVY
jgi:hypothetical protein